MERTVRGDPDDEGVDEAPAAAGGRLVRHPAEGFLGDPEPDLVAVGVVELGPEPERVPTRFVSKYTARAQLKPSGAPEPAVGFRPLPQTTRGALTTTVQMVYLTVSAESEMER